MAMSKKIAAGMRRMGEEIGVPLKGSSILIVRYQKELDSAFL
jgi:hypothetical protein